MRLRAIILLQVRLSIVTDSAEDGDGDGDGNAKLMRPSGFVVCGLEFVICGLVDG